MASNVARILVELYGFREGGSSTSHMGDIDMITTDSPPTSCDDLIASIDVELVVIPSRHRSETGRNSLLAHPVGNWGADTSLGGKPETLSKTSAYAIYRAVLTFVDAAERLKLNGWEIGMEVTHHGPYSEIPTVFVELGSTPQVWGDERMAEVVAEACIAACGSTIPKEVAVGFGGGHYARRFVELMLKKDIAFGHIAPKYRMPVPPHLISQAFEKTVESPSTAYIDWDGIKGEHRDMILRALKALGKEFLRC